MSDDLMAEHTLFGHLFVLRSWLAVIGIGIDADATTGREQPYHLDVLGCHEPHQVFHDDVHAVLMEIAVVAEGEKVELQALGLHHALGRYVHNLDFGKVGLARDRAERRELWAVELYPVVVALMLVLESLQHLGGVVVQIFSLAA